MSAEAERAGVAVERLSAVDAQEPDVAARAALVAPTVAGFPMSAGAFACFASHRLVWERLLASGDSLGLVMEDDLNLAPGLGRLMKPDWIPADADIVKLETWGSRCHVARDGADVDGRRVSRLLSTHIGAGCYILSKATAERLLAMTESYSDPVDELLFNDGLGFWPTAVIYQVTPAPAVQGKRPNDGGDGSQGGWAQSSITERFSAEAGGVAAGRESGAERLVRRVREEARALSLGSRYEVVPFG